MIDVCFFADEVSKDFDEAVKLGVEAGANAVEVRGGIWGKHVTTIDDDDVKQMQDILAKYGAKVASLGSPVGKCHLDNQDEYEEHLRYFDRMVELAHAFDTRVIRGFAFRSSNRGENADRPNISGYLEAIAEKLSRIVPIAERENVTFSTETETSTLIGTCADVRAVSNALGNTPAVTVCWDVMSGVLCGELPYPDGYAHIKGLVTHFHVKPNENQNLNPVGTTDLTYEDLFRAALADGFRGAASIEHWGSPELMLKGIRELRAAIDGMG